MNRHLVLLLFIVLLAINANAQAPAGAAAAHVAAAKAAARQDYAGVLNLCEQPASGQRAAPAAQQANAPAQRTIPPASQWYAEPAKIFDNLYFIGSKDVSAWAITTSDGIILIDSLYDTLSKNKSRTASKKWVSTQPRSNTWS